MNKGLLYGISLLLAFLLGAAVSYPLIKGHFQAISDTFKPDTVEVIKYDTLNILKPVEIEKIKYLTEKVPVYIHDTLNHVDTFYAQREQRVYGDSSYRAVVSGVSPRLDSIEIYQKTITKIATQKEWRKFDYGVQVGVGLVCPVNSTPNFGFYTGFGITYHF